MTCLALEMIDHAVDEGARARAGPRACDLLHQCPYSRPGEPTRSRAVHAHFNGRNLEEASRYVPLSSCDVLVDLLPEPDAPDARERVQMHRGLQPWRTHPFLDAASSPGWSRALYVPVLSDTRNVYAQYALLVRA